jgi:hypothetical protein
MTWLPQLPCLLLAGLWFVVTAFACTRPLALNRGSAPAVTVFATDRLSPTAVHYDGGSEASWFRMSFNEASQSAREIRFDVSSFNPAYARPGMTSWELNQVVNNPGLLGKTTFIQNG